MRTHSCRLSLMAGKPPARLSRAPVKVDKIDRLKKDFRQELQAVPGGGPWVKVDKVDRWKSSVSMRSPDGDLTIRSTKPIGGNLNFRMETIYNTAQGLGRNIFS
jgi:hypothetical protein